MGSVVGVLVETFPEARGWGCGSYTRCGDSSEALVVGRSESKASAVDFSLSRELCEIFHTKAVDRSMFTAHGHV